MAGTGHVPWRVTATHSIVVSPLGIRCIFLRCLDDVAYCVEDANGVIRMMLSCGFAALQRLLLLFLEGVVIALVLGLLLR